MLVRAMQLLSSVEKGTTTGSAMQTALNSDLSLKGEMVEALNLRGIARRSYLSDNIMTAFALSAHAMDALCSSTQAMTFIGFSVSAPTRALSLLMAQDMSIGKVLAYHAGKDAYNYASMTYIAQGAARVTEVMSATNSRNLFLANTIACKAVLDQNNPSTNTGLNSVFGSSSGAYGGQYLNRLRIHDGYASDNTLQSNSLSSIASSSTAAAAAEVSVSAMTAIGDSTTARATITTGSAFFNALTASMAVAKYWAGMAGLDPRSFSNLTDIAANNTILTAIQADASSCTFIGGNMPAALQDELFAVANFRTFVGTSGAIWNAIKGNERAAVKFAIAAGGGNSSGFTTYAGLVASATATANVVSAVQSKTLLYQTDAMLAAFAGSATAMASVRAASGYQVISWTENGSNNVTLTALAGGSAWIVTGSSRSPSGATRTDTYATLRSGTTQTATAAVSATASTVGADANVMIPLQSPFTGRLNTAGTNTHYTGVLRVDA